MSFEIQFIFPLSGTTKARPRKQRHAKRAGFRKRGHAKEPDLGSEDSKKSWILNEKKLAKFFPIKLLALNIFLGQFLCPISVQYALEIATPSL